MHNHVGFIDSVRLSGGSIGPGLRPQGFKMEIASALLPSPHRPTLPHEIIQEPSSTTSETTNNAKCLNLTSATITKLPILLIIIPVILIVPTAAIPTILLTMCGTTLSLMKMKEYWTGYPHLTPRHATTTFEPVGSTEWETGSYKPKNIRIGLVGLIVQPYFVMEVRGLESPILGKREDTQERKCIANKL